jgi:replicative DNA helicase
MSYDRYITSDVLEYQKILNRRLTQSDERNIRDSEGKFKDLDITFETERSLTISDIQARSRKFCQKLERQGKKLAVIFVDHIGLVAASGRYSGARHLELGEITNGLATLAKELDCAVIGMCQFNRGVEAREDKHPGMADLRESGRIEEDAETVVGIYRPHYYLKQKNPDPGTQAAAEHEALLKEKQFALEFMILKQRNGPTETVDLHIHIGANALRDGPSKQSNNQEDAYGR